MFKIPLKSQGKKKKKKKKKTRKHPKPSKWWKYLLKLPKWSWYASKLYKAHKNSWKCHFLSVCNYEREPNFLFKLVIFHTCQMLKIFFTTETSHQKQIVFLDKIHFILETLLHEMKIRCNYQEKKSTLSILYNHFIYN